MILTARYVTCSKVLHRPLKSRLSLCKTSRPAFSFSLRQQHIFPLLRKMNLSCEEYHFEGLFRLSVHFASFKNEAFCSLHHILASESLTKEERRKEMS